MQSKNTTKKSSNSPNSAKSSQAAWLKSLKKGDKVWACQSLFWGEFDELGEVAASFTRETFGGMCGEGFGKNKAWVECKYDGGRLVPVEDLYPTKRAAQLANATEIIAAIKKKRRKLFDESTKWLKLQQKYESLLPNTEPIVEKATFQKLPKTWGWVNGEKF